MKPEREARLQVLVDAGKIKWSAQNSMMRERELVSGMSMSTLNEDKKWTKTFELLRGQ